MPTPLQTTAVQNHDNAGATDTASVTGVVAGSTLIVVIGSYRYTTTGALVSGVSSSNGGALTLARERLRASDDGGGAHRLGLHVYFLPNAASGSHTITVTFTNGSGNYADWFVTEVPGLAATSPHDSAAAADAAFAHGVSSVSVTTGALAQASSFILAAACGQGAATWNGSTTAPMPAPSGFTALRGKVYGGSLDGVPFQASYDDVESVAPVTASWTVPNDSVADGFLAIAVAFNLASGTNYVEILCTPDTEDGVTINASTGWIVHVAAGDPKDGYTVYSGIAAQATGNEIRVPGASAGVAVSGTVNVQVVNAGLGYTSGWGVGTVRAAA
jgi:hypothetical protein